MIDNVEKDNYNGIETWVRRFQVKIFSIRKGCDEQKSDNQHCRVGIWVERKIAGCHRQWADDGKCRIIKMEDAENVRVGNGHFNGSHYVGGDCSDDGAEKGGKKVPDGNEKRHAGCAAFWQKVHR